MRIQYQASDEIRSNIRKISRTEDVIFSPDDKSFILADFQKNRLHQFKFRRSGNGKSRNVEITAYNRIESPDIRGPHGIHYLGKDWLVVCNRLAGISIFQAPKIEDGVQTQKIFPERVIDGKSLLSAKVTTPGSVHSVQLSDTIYRIFVCNNHRHTITSHVIELNGKIRIKNEGILIENTLRFPDGISVSRDGRWIAISNHDYGQVAIFENTPDLNKDSLPGTVLDGPVCPHGIRFGREDKNLYVADASTQYLYIYESDDGNWGDVRNASRAVKIVDDDRFYYGKTGLKDGGVKGIAIDHSNSMLLTTHRMEVIGFYDLNTIQNLDHQPDRSEIAEFERMRDESFNKTGKGIMVKYWPQGIQFVRTIRKNPYLKPSYYKSFVGTAITLKSLKWRNRNSEEPLTDPGGPILSLTSHGKRIESVFYTIESIRQGIQKPSRIILWLDNEDKGELPDSLIRLRKLGLEIHYSEHIGPHKKYYDFVKEHKFFHKPLVTADDDQIYPEYWLKDLVERYKTDPSVIHCYRALRMRIRKDRFIPMKAWKPTRFSTPSHLNYITGASGVIYPPEFLEFLTNAGDKFLSRCPTADDIWLTVNALRSGFKIAQVNRNPKMFTTIPGSQKISLHQRNVVESGNHFQLLDTFTSEDMQLLEECCKREVNQVS